MVMAKAGLLHPKSTLIGGVSNEDFFLCVCVAVCFVFCLIFFFRNEVDSRMDAANGDGCTYNMVDFCCGCFLACEDFGRMFDNSFPACDFLFCFESGD